MRSHRNPFRSRTSEQESYQGLRRFLKTFGVGALDLLPDNVWDRPVVIQSAPGAGKTSLLRTFSAEALHEIATHPHELEELHERMTDLGVIEDGSVKVLGIRLPLKRDYALIDDLRRDDEALAKIFFRLLDAKVVRVVIAALRSAAPDVPVESLRWEPSTAGADALEKIGGPEVSGLMAWSHEAHREMLGWLDSVLPPQGELAGHHGPYSVQALSGAAFTADGRDLEVRPLLMFDDAQDIGRYRRSRLLDALSDRDLELHRWVAERYQALEPHELIGDGEIDRAYAVVHIEAEARRLRPGGAKPTAGDARLRATAARHLRPARAADPADRRRGGARLQRLIDIEVDENHARLRAAEEVLNQRLAELADGNARYDGWLGWAATRSGHKGAVERRVVEILITRDKGRKQDTLFMVPLSHDELRGRWDSDLVEAAALYLREELGLPFYFGPERLTKLASENIDQHIVISGALFEEVLARITMNRPLAIEPFRQDRIVWLVSDQFWRDIPPRLPNGREVQHFLLNVAELCRRATYRPTAPYPPGATATAISMRDRERLLDPAGAPRSLAPKTSSTRCPARSGTT